MTNPRKRGSAPDRARDAHLRPGSFKKGHRKLGGRKRGTPNAFSPDYKQAILEAAHRVGHDGNGEDGAVGYFSWVGERDPDFFIPWSGSPCCRWKRHRPTRQSSRAGHRTNATDGFMSILGL